MSSETSVGVTDGQIRKKQRSALCGALLVACAVLNGDRGLDAASAVGIGSIRDSDLAL